MGSPNITFEIDGQRFEVSSSWLRDEAELGRHEHSVRGAVLDLLEIHLLGEWAAMGRVDSDRADDVRQLAVFSQFIASLEAHNRGDLDKPILVGYDADERLVSHISEGELERMEQHRLAG